MSKLETLTPEQETKKIEIRNFWINYIDSCKNTIDKEEARIGVEFIYDLAKCAKPKIVYVDSPLAGQYAVHFLKTYYKELEKLLGEQSEPNLANVRDNVGDSKIEFENFAFYGGIQDYGWVSFYDFFTQIGVINHDGFNRFRKLMLSGVYDMIQLNDWCIVCGLPSQLTRNAVQQLHSTAGPAIKWNDGCEYYFINGRSLPAKHFKSISDKKFTMKDFINEPNEEYKSTCIALMQELYGDEHLVNFFSEHMKEVNTFVDKKSEAYLKGTTGGMNVGVYTLFKGHINNEQIAYVRCYCPSTDRMFFLGVENKHSTAKNAIASLYRIPQKLSNHIATISRQGERYNTTFTAEGEQVLSGLSKDEIADLTSISGHKYFELITYEY